MNVFLVPRVTGNMTELNQEESRHCIRVLRMRTGEQVQLIDGVGGTYDARIVVPDPNACRLEIVSARKTLSRAGYTLTIAIAPTKNTDRFEWFAEKCTEIGIDRIIPVICRHSERKELKPDRVEKILASAVKQSGQLWLPVLERCMPFTEVANMPFEGDKLIAHCGEDSKTSLKNAITPGKDVLILIGPEGDFDASEINLALENGFRPVSLGMTRLRTETAGVVACHTVNLLNEK